MADPVAPPVVPQADVDMSDSPLQQPATNGVSDTATTPAANLTAPPAPVSATSTPARTSSQPPQGIIAPPEKPAAHGSPTRVYLNQNVTPHLLEGMKYIAAYEPEKPLRWLSEFLAKRSAELEGS
ncbi:hypothetical protein K461DRAFT_321993 [Myriangium duriaei CBS 260.36]|uniref:Uncharacterized protein n=1 Tax=Myriangium duriaei CBS 260.36 TaxID=1168546 RepID=A0A9P4IXQ5_9PEZI|nr:hypothetical protein K461DRAFT_321993 [Myriangium duriaei CBS 260.36]